MASVFTFRSSPYSFVNRFPIGAVFFDKLVEHADVLERAVHPLPIKRHDRMSRIAKQQCLAAGIPRKTFDRAEIAGWICEEIFGQRRHQRNGVGEVGFEELK